MGVKDGDTVEVLHDGRAVTVRLRGIDTPESEEGSDLLLEAYEIAREVFNEDKAEGIAWTLRETWERRMLQDAA